MVLPSEAPTLAGVGGNKGGNADGTVSRHNHKDRESDPGGYHPPDAVSSTKHIELYNTGWYF